MTLTRKLFLIVFSNILIVLATVGVGFYSLNKLEQSEKELLKASTALSNHQNVDMMHDAIRGDVLNAQFITSKDTIKPEEVSEVLSDLKEHTANITEAVSKNTKLNLPSEIRSELVESEGDIKNYSEVAYTTINKILKDKNSANDDMKLFKSAFGELEEKLGSISDKIISNLEKTTDSEEQSISRAKACLLGMLVLSVIAGAISLIILRRSVVNVLSGIMLRLNLASQQLVSSSAQVASSSQSLAQGATEQAASLQESAASIEEISSASKHNTDNSE